MRDTNYRPDLSYIGSDIKIPIFFPNPEKHWGPKRKAAVRKVMDKGE